MWGGGGGGGAGRPGPGRAAPGGACTCAYRERKFHELAMAAPELERFRDHFEFWQLTNQKASFGANHI